MVTLRVTIKRFALACLCKAQNSFPLKNHGHPKGDNLVLLLKSKILIITLWVTMVFLRKTIKGEALDLVRSTSMVFYAQPKGA